MRSSTRQIGGLNTARPNNAHHHSPSSSSGTRKRYWHAVATLGCTVLALTYMALPGAAQTWLLARRHGLSVAVPLAARPLAINWALSGQATASTAQPGDPSSNAIDGDAVTSWCAASWPDTLTVDLAQIRDLDGIGITLDNASSSANASISLATQAGAWQPVPSAQNIALDPGNPMYIPLGPSGPRSQAGAGASAFGGNIGARYAQLTVWDSGGAPVCVGEFRLFGPDPTTSGMMLGADMSFTAQELAAGVVFTDNGAPTNPIDIMAANGASWARLRLWVNPPPVTATSPRTWPWLAA